MSIVVLAEDRRVTMSDTRSITDRLNQSMHKQNLADFYQLLRLGTDDLVVSSAWLNGESWEL